MKKLFIIIAAVATMLSCSKDDEGDTNTETIINLTTPTNTVVVDDLVTVQLTSSEPIKIIEVSSDNINFSGFNVNDITSTTLYFTFDIVGTQTKYIRFTNTKDYKSVTKTITFNVIRNNTIRIKGVKVNSFYNINQTWDPEFSATDPNRLADIYVAFGKDQLINFKTNTFSYQKWYYSAVKENQGDLTWDFTNESLYFRQNSIIQFSLADYDTPVAINFLVPNSDRFVYLDFTPYIATKPTTITFDFPLDQLQFVLTVDWQ